MIQVGIIGCGAIAQRRHLPEYAANPDAEIYGVYDLNKDRARQLAEAYGARAYDSIEEMLGEPAIDAVSVCVANHAHAEVSIAALRAGKHVLCEKPMAVTLRECREMVQAAEESGRYLMVGHNQRLARAHVKAKALLRQGEIGALISFRTTFGHGGPETWSVDSGASTWFFDKKRASMGVMADLGVHKTDLMQFFCDSHVRRVTARLATLDKRYADGRLIDVDDHAFCIYEMENGVIGTMTASWSYYGAEDNSTVLYGSEGIMRIYDHPTHSIVVNKKNGETYYYDVDAIQTNSSQTNSGVIDLWVDCLTRRRPPELSGAEALYAMQAVFAAIESSRTGKSIEICDEI